MRSRGFQRIVLTTLLSMCALSPLSAEVGVGAKPLPNAEVILDGTRELLDKNWIYWEGPRFASKMPIQWKIVEDPEDKGRTAVMTDDPAAVGGKYGTADIVTKKAYKDFRLHVEFLIMKPKGNSGVYLQNRYEIQILDGDKTSHGMAAIINEAATDYSLYNGLGKWNAYDVTFRAARFNEGKRVEQPVGDVVLQRKKGSCESQYHQSVGRTKLGHGWGQ